MFKTVNIKKCYLPYTRTKSISNQYAFKKHALHSSKIHNGKIQPAFFLFELRTEHATKIYHRVIVRSNRILMSWSPVVIDSKLQQKPCDSLQEYVLAPVANSKVRACVSHGVYGGRVSFFIFIYTFFFIGIIFFFFFCFKAHAHLP